MNSEETARSEAARAMGRARSEKKAASGRENVAKALQARWDRPGARERQAEALREAHRRRREAKGRIELSQSEGSSEPTRTESHQQYGNGKGRV